MSQVDFFRKQFGNRLKKILEIKKMSYKELAEKMGVDKSAISKYVSGGDRAPKMDTFLAICDALEISADYFLNESITLTKKNQLPSDSRSIMKSIAILINNNFFNTDPYRGDYIASDNKAIHEFINEVYRYKDTKVRQKDEILIELIEIYSKEYDEIEEKKILDELEDLPF